MFPDIKLGIEPIKSETPPSMDDMRRAIEKGGRDSHLIRAALDSARYNGFSGEDTYVYLAYQALIHLEDAHKRLMRMVSLTPGPITFEMPGNEPTPERRNEQL